MSGIDDLFGNGFTTPTGVGGGLTDLGGRNGAFGDAAPGDSGSEGAARNFRGLRMMRRSPLLDEALRYWTSLREGSDLPHRSALDPKEMRLILGHAMVLDRIRHGTVRIRLGGGAMERLMGMNVRGLPIRALFDLSDRTRAADLFEQVFDAPAMLELDLISEGPGGLVTGRMLVLPLRDAGGAVSKALTVMVTDRTVDEARRFCVTNSTLLPLAPVNGPQTGPRRRHSDAPVPLPGELRAPLREMAEPGAAFEGKPSRVPWLRVVK